MGIAQEPRRNEAMKLATEDLEEDALYTKVCKDPTTNEEGQKS